MFLAQPNPNETASHNHEKRKLRLPRNRFKLYFRSDIPEHSEIPQMRYCELKKIYICSAQWLSVG